VNPIALVQTARATRRALAHAPVPAGWTRDAVTTQVRLAGGRVGHSDGHVQVQVGAFEVTGFSVSSLAHLHREIFVDLQYWFRARRSDPVIVDGGSNIGMSLLFFKVLYPGARVIAFEPAARAHELLIHNVERNSLQDVEVHGVALGPDDGQVAFFEDPADPATFRMSTRAERIPGEATTVPQRRLSPLLEGEVDLVKLDIEGAEDAVLAELIASGAIDRVDQLVLEYHHQLDPDRDPIDRFLARLRESGFSYQLSAAERVTQRSGQTAIPQDVLVYARRRT
jgi:FkbM family methyltransferase